MARRIFLSLPSAKTEFGFSSTFFYFIRFWHLAEHCLQNIRQQFDQDETESKEYWTWTCFSFISPFIIFVSSSFCLFLVLHSLESSNFIRIIHLFWRSLIFRSWFSVHIFRLVRHPHIFFGFFSFFYFCTSHSPGKLSMTLPFLIALYSYWCWAYRIDGSVSILSSSKAENFCEFHAYSRTPSIW